MLRGEEEEEEEKEEEIFAWMGASATGKKLDILLDLTLKSSYHSDFT